MRNVIQEIKNEVDRVGKIRDSLVSQGQRGSMVEAAMTGDIEDAFEAIISGDMERMRLVHENLKAWKE